MAVWVNVSLMFMILQKGFKPQCELREKTFNPIGEVKYGVNALHKFEVKVEEKKILHFWLFRLEMEERPIKVSQ
jgi:hypothetical protein